VLLARCSRELLGGDTRPLTDERRARIVKSNEELAGEALRTLGVAFRSLPASSFVADNVDAGVEQDLVFAGLIGMIDPHARKRARPLPGQRRQGYVRL
jgi:Ca2+-transporting ATPase